MLIATHTTPAELTDRHSRRPKGFTHRDRCGTQSRAFLCSWVKERKSDAFWGEIALADGEKSVESGPYLERAEKTGDGHSHLSKHGHTADVSGEYRKFSVYPAY